MSTLSGGATAVGSPTPLLNGDTIAWSRRVVRPGVLSSANQALSFVSGRYGLLRILRDIEVGKGDEVLFPAYHSPALLSPAELIGAKIVLYDVDEQLEPDLDDLRAKLSDRSRAVVVVHFFGFPRSLDAVGRLAAEHGLVLVEDCAHQFPHQALQSEFHPASDYRFGSYMKFAPTFDGGFARSRTGWRRQLANRRQGGAAEIRALTALLERSARFGRLGPLSVPVARLMAGKDAAWFKLKQSGAVATQDAAGAVYGSYGLEPHFEGCDATRLGLWLLNKLDAPRCISLRRRNFDLLSDELRKISGIRLLHPVLGEDEVPYVLPLIVQAADRVYATLRTQDVPVFRWDVMTKGDCRIANSYARDLVQVACHQDLQGSHLDAIVASFQAAVSSQGK